MDAAAGPQWLPGGEELIGDVEGLSRGDSAAQAFLLVARRGHGKVSGRMFTARLGDGLFHPCIYQVRLLVRPDSAVVVECVTMRTANLFAPGFVVL